jgi:hypothetical protein
MRRLPLAVLVGAGAFGLHELRYIVVYRSEAAEVLALRDHAYLPLVTPVVAALLVLWLRRLVLARRAPVSTPRVWAAVSALLLAVYAAQELLEGALVPDHPSGLQAVAGHGGWTALALAALLGLLVAVALRGVEAAASAVTAVAARLPLPRPLLPATFALPAARRPKDAVADFLAGRGPPVPPSDAPQYP